MAGASTFLCRRLPCDRIAGAPCVLEGWNGDNLGCSVEARVVPIEGKAQDFAGKQADYGNHLVWVYGHYADELQQLGKMLGMEVDVVG